MDATDSQQHEATQGLVIVRGKDQPGVMDAFLSVLRDHGCCVVDLAKMRADVYITILFTITFEPGTSLAVIKDMLLAARAVDVEVSFQLDADAAASDGGLHADGSPPQGLTHFASQRGPAYAVVALGKNKGQLPLAFIQNLVTSVAKLGCHVSSMRRLSTNSLWALEMGLQVDHAVEEHRLGSELDALAQEHGVDVVVQETHLLSGTKRLVALDFDRCIVSGSITMMLAEAHGCADEMAAAIAEMDSGCIPHDEAIARQVALLAGMSRMDAEETLRKIPYTQGCRHLCRFLHKLGYRVAVISSSTYDIVLEQVKKDIEVDYVFGNNLELVHGKLTGHLAGPVVTVSRKQDLLRGIMMMEDIKASQIVAIGNGSRSVSRCLSGCLQIEFNTDPADRAPEGHYRLSDDLTHCLFVMGYTEADMGYLNDSKATAAYSRLENNPEEDEDTVVDVDCLSVTLQGPTNKGRALHDIIAEMTPGVVSILNVIVNVSQAATIIMLVLQPTAANAVKTTIKDLLFAAKEAGFQMHYDMFDRTSLARKRASRRLRYNLTLSKMDGLTTPFLADLAQKLAMLDVGVATIRRVSSKDLRVLDFQIRVPRDVNIKALKTDLVQLAAAHGTDVAIQASNLLRRSKRLIIFDMDSTLIQMEVIDEIAKHAGVGRQVEEITERAMRGEMDFNESLRTRASLLKGLDASVFQKVRDSLVYTDGVPHLTRVLKKLGYKMAVISGGFTEITDFVKGQLGLDYSFANKLEVVDGRLTGVVDGEIVDGQRKADLLSLIAQREGVALEQVVAVGDGSNDLAMLCMAGLGVGYCAKPIIRENADIQVNQKSLSMLRYILGISDVDYDELGRGDW